LSITFEINTDAIIKAEKTVFSFNLPKMKAIYLNYQLCNKVLNALLRDAQTLTYKHVIKADDILEQPNP
jgi:hypothetical protein